MHLMGVRRLSMGQVEAGHGKAAKCEFLRTEPLVSEAHGGQNSSRRLAVAVMAH